MLELLDPKDPMEIAVFSTKSYDRQFLDAAASNKHTLHYVEAQLTADTAVLARNADAVDPEAAQAGPSVAIDPAVDMTEGDVQVATEAPDEAPDDTTADATGDTTADATGDTVADTMTYAMTVVPEGSDGVAPELAEPAVEVTDELSGPQVEGAAVEPSLRSTVTCRRETPVRRRNILWMAARLSTR